MQKGSLEILDFSSLDFLNCQKVEKQAELAV